MIGFVQRDAPWKDQLALACLLHLAELLNFNLYYMKALKFKMYSSLIFGTLFILLGLYLFINMNDRSAARFLIMIGLGSTAISLYLFFTMNRKIQK
jgi:hypothetical protein